MYCLDFVLDRPTDGFPAEVLVKCIEPEGYKTKWVDNIWNNGRWKNIEKMADPAGSTGVVPKPRCIDPNKCYHPRPNVPFDWSVEIIDQGIDPKENTVNTTFLYKCTTESKL